MKIFQCLVLMFLTLLIIDTYSMMRKRKRIESKDEKQKRLNEYLKLSIFAKDWEKTKELVRQGADINYNDGSKALLLILTSNVSDETDHEIIKFLASVPGTDLNIKDGYGDTPLINACTVLPNLAIIKTLIENGADVNLSNKKRVSPLITSCVSDNHIVALKAAKLLIKYGAKLNQKSASGRTALMAAAYTGNIRLVTFLLLCGADTNLKDRRGYDVFRWIKNTKIREKLENIYNRIMTKKFKIAYRHTPLNKDLLKMVFNYL